MRRKIFLGAVASIFLLGAGCVSFSSSSSGTLLGIYRSADKGENWQSINIFPSKDGVKSISGVKVYRVFTDPSDNNALYMGSRDQGLFYSYDRGETWQTVASFKNRFIYSVAVDPTDKCTILVTDGSQIYRSEDCMRTWSTVYSEAGRQVISLGFDYGNHNNIYAATENGVILNSQNGGNSWRAIKDFRLVLRQMTTDPRTPGRIYVATSLSGLFRSDDGGTTWENASEGLQSFSEGLYFYRLVLDSGKKDNIYWMSKYGIFRSTDAGKSWTDLKLVTSPGSVNIYNFVINPKNSNEMYYTGTIIGANNAASTKLYKSTDGGASWFNRKLPSNAIPSTLFLHPENTNLLYVAFTTAS